MVNKRIIIKASVSCDYECTKRFEGTVKEALRNGWVRIGKRHYCPEHGKLKEVRPFKFKKQNCVCQVCGKTVSKVLDLSNPRQEICSINCFDSFWLDIIF